jgi:hypothetical protein
MPEYKFNPAAFVDKQHTSILAAVVLHTTSGSCREKHGLDLIDVDDIGNEIYISKFVPINCIDNLVFGFNSTSINNPGNINCGLDMPLEVLSAEIRLIITYQFLTSDHNGVPNRTIQIATYPLKVNSLSSRYNNNPQIISPFYDFPQHLHVGSLSPIGQYAMIGNTIFAWDDITISGNLSLPSGFSSIDLVAPRVTILPGASLGAGITFHERKMPVDCGEAHEWSGDLSSFCHSDDYKAKYLIPEKSRATSNQSVNSISEDNLAAFPNPAKDNINFSFDLKEKGTVNLYITDMMGQPVGRILSNENLNIGQYKYDYNLSGLNAGIYICILECPEGKRISKFEIIR